jgi:Peptidase family U32
MSEIRDALAAMGLPAGDLHALPDSALRFPDGAHYRIEIPSTEGPDCLRAVLDSAARLDVRVHRVSQGSGVFMLTDAELDDMASVAREARVEVSLFARPNAGWDASATAAAPAGAMLAAASRGQEQVVQGLADIARAAEHGIRSVLIADLGLLAAFQQLRSSGALPADMQAKLSALFPVTNPATARVLVDLGANTLNISSDLTLPQIAAIRAAVDVPIDFYIEAPDGLGGFVRHHDVPEIIRIAAPVYLKFGVRGAPDIYPWSGHIAAVARALSEERVRRAALALELLGRSGAEFTTSELGAAGLALPVERSAAPAH